MWWAQQVGRWVGVGMRCVHLYSPPAVLTGVLSFLAVLFHVRVNNGNYFLWHLKCLHNCVVSFLQR